MKKNKLKNADIFKVDLVPAGAQQLSKISIMKSKEAGQMAKVKKGISEASLTKLEQFLAALGEILEDVDGETDPELLAAEGAEVTEKAEGCEPGKEGEEPVVEKAEEGDEGDVAKMSPEILKKMADMEASNKALLKKMAQLEDEKLTKEYVAKAAGMTSIPGATTEELAMIMKSFSAFCPDKAEKLENIFKSANEAIAKGGLFEEFGSSMDNSAVSGVTSKDEAWAKIEQMTNDIVKKGAGSSNPLADVLATPEGRRLYAIYEGGK